MSRFEKALNTLQSRTIIDYIRKNAPAMVTRSDIEDFAFEMIEKLEKDFPADFPVNNSACKSDNPHFSYLAFSFAHCARFAIQTGSLTGKEYISILADVKETNENDVRDFGAFGDLFEILIRCAFMRRYSLVKWSTLAVKDIEKLDMESKKYGKVEIGHNGKTFSYGTLFDYMSGDFTSVVYGVFNDEDKKEIYKLCRMEEYEKAIDYVTTYSVYWENKYTFQNDMDNLTRGKGIAKKGGSIQVVYNSGKYNAFLDAIENGTFVSLYEMLKRK